MCTHCLKISKRQKQKSFVNTFSAYQTDVFLECHKPVINSRIFDDLAGASNAGQLKKTMLTEYINAFC